MTNEDILKIIKSKEIKFIKTSETSDNFICVPNVSLNQFIRKTEQVKLKLSASASKEFEEFKKSYGEYKKFKRTYYDMGR